LFGYPHRNLTGEPVLGIRYKYAQEIFDTENDKEYGNKSGRILVKYPAG
jgi:hypothetical protein